MEDNGTSQSAYERNCSFSANCSQNDDFFHFAFSDSSAVAAALISWCCVQVCKKELFEILAIGVSKMC